MDNRVQRGHAPQYMQNFAIGFRPRGLVADIVCPRVRVEKTSDKYRVYGKQLFQQRDGKRAPGAPPVEIRIDYSNDQYYADEHAWRHPLLDSELANSDADIDLKTRYEEACLMAASIAREARVCTKFTTAGNYAGSHVVTKAGGQEWDLVPGNAITDIENMLNIVADDAAVPMSALSLVLPEIAFRKGIKHNANYLDRIKYSSKGVVTTDLLAEVHGIKEVILSSAMALAQPEKVVADITSPAPSYLWLDNVWVGVIGEDTNDLTPKFARTFNNYAATGGQPRQVFEYRDADPGTRKSWIEVAEALDEKITAKMAGGLIKNTLSTI